MFVGTLNTFNTFAVGFDADVDGFDDADAGINFSPVRAQFRDFQELERGLQDAPELLVPFFSSSMHRKAPN